MKDAEKMAKEADEKLEKVKAEAASNNKKLAADT